MTVLAKKDAEKKASLWEKTIVTAFRDLQWKYKSKDKPVPSTNVGLAGNSERALGDGIVAADDRLYLLEIKAEKSGRSAEWQPGDEKRAYSSLKDALNLASVSRSNEAALQGFFIQSLRAHHFLYWTPSPKPGNPLIRPGALTISPYLLDAAIHAPINNLKISQEIFSNNAIAIKSTTGPTSSFEPKAKISAHRIFDGTGKILNFSIMRGTLALRLGLTPAELKSYVETLISYQEEKDLPINAILASENGDLCQHLSHLDDLLALLESLINSPNVEAPVDLSKIETKRLFSNAEDAVEEPESGNGMSMSL
ncbi:hypothetical protein [Pseudoxanthomonas winnipegensis]|uniref:hypothetical protein n=1 Tax=Pseudoxanthomonas winnipegensis TaxID=2480810 RepID=UPI00102D9815|nr:hypothetical protein [Pseudoxanthomonas winnipegensis]TAA10888.1 hypothetical protein EA659_05825 [Pseudoxanthomonas winnipegensis]TAH74311.1 hypothetical protein EA657_02335 [Pseudoxanthomonas winnipegensis]